MVCLPDQMPLLLFGAHEVASFDDDWLVDAISKAAAKAGHEDWFFAKDITRAVVKYLRHRHQRNSITVEELYHKIENVLHYLGCGDIAQSLEIGPPPMVVSLKAIARDSAAGDKGEFFGSLAEHIGDFESSPVDLLVFDQIRSATKRLCEVTRWTPECEAMVGEIVGFINAEVGGRCGERDVRILIR